MKKLLKFSLIPISILGISSLVISCKEQISIKGSGQSVQDVVLSSVSGSGQYVEDEIYATSKGTGQYVEDRILSSVNGLGQFVENEKVYTISEEDQQKLNLLKEEKLLNTQKWFTFISEGKVNKLETDLTSILQSYSGGMMFIARAFITYPDKFKKFEEEVAKKIPKYGISTQVLILLYNQFLSSDLKIVKEHITEFNNLFNKYFVIEQEKVKFRNLYSEIENKEEFNKELERLFTITNDVFEIRLASLETNFAKLTEIKKMLDEN
ncbi:hypothetical protein [Mesomycoplasma lagogenitalium]|uniref:Lipoprotein n=1 Tax=Mesomycoplasma lagogenitalium TaxID=171286 RepID=A0ABY8LUD8_9BACT|nr:hypothetical protein [Mesomycoplasma lagogenitalium]WGI36846.1 hypothetical protein QEG99_01005 [Mesomycoplasma lagogenitalium]